MAERRALIFIAALAAFAALASCGTADAGARGGTGWEGIYEGTVPGADSRINVEIELRRDGTYTAAYRYIDKGPEVFTWYGTFTWRDNNTVRLNNGEIPPYYIVGNGTLTQLSMSGDVIVGPNAADYVLRKK